MRWMPVSALALAIASAPAAVPRPEITLEIRVFAGTQDVTSETRISVYRAGERRDPLAQETARAGRLQIPVAAGMYDVQAIRERDDRVVGIRWAERLVVMAYPDEGGHHLEVVNLEQGYGALQVRSRGSSKAPEAGIFASGQRGKEAAARVIGDTYALFVVPAGRYDLRVGSGEQVQWQTDIDVPLDRTRLWIVP